MGRIGILKNRIALIESTVADVKSKVIVLKELAHEYNDWEGEAGLCYLLRSLPSIDTCEDHDRESWLMWFNMLLWTTTGRSDKEYVWEKSDVVSRRVWLDEQILRHNCIVETLQGTLRCYKNNLRFFGG